MNVNRYRISFPDQNDFRPGEHPFLYDPLGHPKHYHQVLPDLNDLNESKRHNVAWHYKVAIVRRRPLHVYRSSF